MTGKPIAARVLSFLGRKQAVAPATLGDSHGRSAAAAALLVEAALHDGIFPEQERTCVVGVLTGKYALTSDQAEACLAAAIDSNARVHAVANHLSAVVCGMDDDTKLALIAAMWEVAYADGELTAGESTLIESVAALIGVPRHRCREAHDLVREGRSS